jgi:tRNA pseudouridine55 synthase
LELDVNGVLIVDKPSGMTSHDVVAAARRALRERRIGHTGTLDPLATGVLPLACGLATRLVRFLSASDKDYEATIRFGVTTDTYDIAGTELTRSDLRPTAGDVERALASLRGAYDQVPPAYSAKKVGGQRAYDLARRNETVELAAVPVRVDRTELLAFTGVTATVALTCSAGFYVRSFAHALGERTGTGACLEALRRTRSGQFGLEEAVDLERLVSSPPLSPSALPVIPLEGLMTTYPWGRVGSEGRRRIGHGQLVRPEDLLERGGTGDWTRILDAEGHLVAVARTGPTADSLHPSVVLI